MSQKLNAYLTKRADLDSYSLGIQPVLDSPQLVVVIPVLAEADNLPYTLESLGRCNPDCLAKTLVIIVVNNRGPEHVDADVIENNQRCIKWLNSMPYPNLHLSYVDASSSGQELKPKEGVGTARKIGMDRALACLDESDGGSPLIVCLDADTLVEADYLDAVFAYAERDDAWAGVINYAHPLPEGERERAAIVSYELFLRYQHLAMSWAQSPYAFHTIGSTIVCTPQAYAAVSGMNRRAAGEDFYFLQQLAKTGPIGFIHDTTVYPSARVSWRVPFGTGKRVGRFMDGTHEEYRVYHCESYAIVKTWLSIVNVQLNATVGTLLAKAESIHPALRTFLEQQNFAEHWPKLQEQAANDLKLWAQFNGWFDAFKTLKLIHHLRDEAFPDQPTFDAYRSLESRAPELGLPGVPGQETPSLDVQVEFLQNLRNYMRDL